MNNPHQFMHDMERHFTDRLRQLMIDTVDTFERVDVHKDRCTAAIVAVLGKEMAYITIACGGREDELVTLIRNFFRQVREANRMEVAR